MKRFKNITKADLLQWGVKVLLKIAVYGLIIFAVINICRGAFSFGYDVFNENTTAEEDGQEVTVEIPIGASTFQIGKILEKNGLVEDRKLFVLQEFLSNYHGKIQPGTYVLNTAQTTDEMLAVLSGDVEPAEEEP